MGREAITLLELSHRPRTHASWKRGAQVYIMYVLGLFKGDEYRAPEQIAIARSIKPQAPHFQDDAPPAHPSSSVAKSRRAPLPKPYRSTPKRCASRQTHKKGGVASTNAKQNNRAINR